MANHRKPTTKELEEQSLQELDELEKLEKEEAKNNPPAVTEDPPSSPPPVAEPTPDTNIPDPDADDTPSLSPSKPPIPTPSPSKPPKDEDNPPPSPSPSPDYKEKFKQSSRNAQKLYGQNKIFDEAIDALEDMPEPTDDEMEAEFPDWAIMGESEKTIAKEAVVSRQFRKIMSEARQKAKKVENWEQSVDKFIEDPAVLAKNPDLEGKQEEFKEFAKKDEHRSVAFPLLVSAFLHEQSKKVDRKKGSQFQTGGGGPSTPPKKPSDKISLAQAEALKKNNYKLYKKYLLADKIADE